MPLAPRLKLIDPWFNAALSNRAYTKSVHPGLAMGACQRGSAGQRQGSDMRRYWTTTLFYAFLKYIFSRQKYFFMLSYICLENRRKTFPGRRDFFLFWVHVCEARWNASYLRNGSYRRSCSSDCSVVFSQSIMIVFAKSSTSHAWHYFIIAMFDSLVPTSF